MDKFKHSSLNGQVATATEKKQISLKELTETGELQTLPIKAQPTIDNSKQIVPSPKNKNRKPLIFAIAGIGLIAASNFGYKYWEHTSTHQETDNAQVAGDVHPVSSRINGTVTEVPINDNQLVKKGELLVKLDPSEYQVKILQAQASLEAAKRQANAAQSNISLAAETTQGKTTQAQGDISGAVAAISTAQAAVSEAQAGIPTAQAQVAEAQAGITAAEAQVAQADATLQKTQTDYNRYTSLFEQGAVNRQLLDTAKAAYEVALAQKSAAQQQVQQAQARLAQAKEGVSKAQARLAQSQEGVTTAQARLAASKGGLQQATASGQQTQVNSAQYEAAKAAISQAEAALKDTQLQLSYTNIFAPASGRVGRKSVQVGQRVQPGSSLMAIVENNYWVTANFKETQLKDIKPGQKAEVKLDAFPNHPFVGRVESIAPASGSQFALLPPDNATGNFTKVVQRIPVKVTLDAESIKGYESRIAPGMSAIVSVEHK
ncbi:MAG: HlyD family secretion protein [Potamolinea sp.]